MVWLQRIRVVASGHALGKMVRYDYYLERACPMIIENLPTQPTAFVGRAEELVEIGNLLDTPECRLLTLVGPGGVGKTRLALEVATVMLNRKEMTFPNGVYFAPLQPIASPDFLLSALAEAVGFKFY